MKMYEIQVSKNFKFQNLMQVTKLFQLAFSQFGVNSILFSKLYI